MKRTNPATGEPFKAGDTREDGYIFRRYAYSYGLKKDGYWPEQWYSPKALKKGVAKNRAQNKARLIETREALSAYKIKKGCTDCGYNAHPAALDFDHMPGQVKSFTIGSDGIRNRARIWQEVAKCEVVCANCHRIRTFTRLGLTESVQRLSSTA